ncbi:MAG: fibronectin type III domain-containing protein, partial [Desulforegulaceae bacterium]|nr:fibronectin type III domain-containing protein [Desulforegulaceae bacterium]
MKKLLFFLMAIIFAITGNAQTPLVENFSNTAFPPTDWVKLNGLVSQAFNDTLPTSTSLGWTRVATNNGITNPHTKLNVYGTTCKYWLVTPTIDLGGGGNYALTFDLALTDYANADVPEQVGADDKFMVIVSTDNGLTWSQSNATIWDNEGSTNVFSNIPNTAQNISIDLSAYTGQIKIAFYGESTVSGGDNDLHIGNIYVTTCPAPSGLLANNITTSSADLTWNLTNALDYSFEYKLSSDADWTSATSIPSLSINSYSVQGLIANTSYDYRVKANCVPGVDESIWSESSFRTACETITQFPWIEGFENDFNSIAIAPGNKPAPFCWFIIDSLNTSSYFWKTSTSAYRGSKSIYMNGYSTNSSSTTASYQNNEWLITPIMSLTGNERLNFWAKKSSSSYYPDLLIYAMDVSQGDLNTTASNSNFVYIGEIDTTVLSTTYSEYEFDLSTLVGDYRLAFVRKKTASGSVYIDDVKVSAIPTCFPPTDIAISNITTDQAELNFTPANFADFSWYVVLEDLSTNLTDTTQIFTFPHTFLNLTPNTNYNVTIMTDCGDGTFSDPTLPVTFRTQCVPVTVPFLEDFSTSVVVEPTCWTRMNGLLADTSVLTPMTSGWIHSTSLDNAMRVNIYGTGVKYWLISPTIDLGMDGSLYQLDFDVVYSDLSTGLQDPTHSDDDIFAVVVSSDNGATWSKANARIWYASPDSTYSLTSFSPTSTHISLKLEDENMIPYSGNIKIALYGESTVALSGADNYLFVDNFEVDLAPMCPAVFNTTASVDNFSTIRVNFATDNAEPGIGWDIAYAETDPTSFDPNTSTIIPINDASQLPYLITGLNAGSTYSIAVRQNCGGDWSETVSATIPNLENAVTLPYIQDFEDLNNIAEWTLLNPDTNKWYISNAVSYPDNTGNSLYISKDLGVSNEYVNNVTSYAYASALIDFGVGAAEYSLSFDWRANGESSSYDYMKVFLLSIDQAIPTTGWPNGQALGTYNQQTTWQSANFVLPVNEYENTVKKLVFVWWNDGSGGTDPAAAVDNIQITPLTCPTPSNLVLNSATTNSLDLSWASTGASTQWLVEYSDDNIVWQSQIANTNTNFILNGLNHSSTYSVRVYTLCSPIDTSFSVDGSFNTECAVINQFPWEESFEGITQNNQIPNCWTATNLNSKTYTYISDQSSRNRIARTGTKFASFSYGANDNFTTPAFDLIAGNNYTFTFWYITDGLNGWENLQVRAIDLSDTSNNMVIGTPVLNANNETYELYVSNFTPTTTGQYKFSIECQATSSPWYLSFDDVRFEEANCLFPENVQISNVTPSSVDMTWDAGVGTQWIVDYKISTDTVWTSDIAFTNQYAFTPLNPQTNYDFRVATLCGADTSLFITLSETTPCDYITILPWNENFDNHGTPSTTLFPDCWSRFYNATSANPYISGTNFSSPGSMYFTAASGKYSIAATPGFDPSIPINTLSALFRLRTSNATSNLIIGVMTNPNDITTFDSLSTITPSATSTWEEIEFDFANYTGTGNFIAFKSEYNTVTNTFYIDDLSVYYTPSCARPIAISATSLTNSIDVTITPADPSDTEWMIYFRDLNTTDWDSIPAVTSVVTIPNLLSQTEYEIYAKTACFDGTYSNATNSIIVYTQQISEQIPYSCDFETPGTNGWLLKNGTCTNKWMIGTPTSGTSNALFVSNNDADASYTLNSFSIVVAEKLFEFNTTDSIQLSFDLTVGGESSWDYLKVFLVDKDTAFNPSTATTYFAINSYAEGIIMQNGSNNYINLLTGTQTLSTTFASPGIGVEKKLVFVWKNDGSGGNGNSSIIDNILITTSNPCSAPTDLIASNITSNSADISWMSSGSEVAWQVREGEEGTPVDIASTSYSISQLTPNTEYTYYVRSDCGSGSYSAWASVTFTTEDLQPNPQVSTLPVTVFDHNSATFNGSYTEGSDAVTAIGFEYKEQSATTWTNTPITPLVSPFSYDASSLTPNTAYQVRAFATTASGTFYGDTSTFTTNQLLPPTVTTTDVDVNNTAKTATFQGSTEQGTESIIARGFEYKFDTASWENAIDLTATGSTNITATATGLIVANYNVRAYAETNSGRTYG